LPAPGRATRGAVAFQVCPRCIAERRLVTRAHGFPLALVCARHGVLLVARCACGATLAPFRRGAPPFACRLCARPWSALPEHLPSAEVVQEQRLIHDLLALFLARPTPALRLAAAELLLPADRLGVLDGKGRERPCTSLGLHAIMGLSLVRLIAHLVVRHGDAATLSALVDERAGRPRCCLNRACPAFGLAAVGTMRARASSSAIEVAECRACGALHVDGHLFRVRRPGEDGMPGADSARARRGRDRERRQLARPR